MFEMLWQKITSLVVSFVLWIVGLFTPAVPPQPVEPDYPMPQYQDEVVVIGDKFTNGILGDSVGNTNATFNEPATKIISSYEAWVSFKNGKNVAPLEEAFPHTLNEDYFSSNVLALIDVALPSSSYFVCVSDAYDLDEDNTVNVTYHCVENTTTVTLDVVTYNTIAVCVSHCAKTVNAIKGESYKLPCIPSEMYGNKFAKVNSSALEESESLLITSKSEWNAFCEKAEIDTNSSLLSNLQINQSFFEDSNIIAVAVYTEDNTTAEISYCDVENGACEFGYCLVTETGRTTKRACAEIMFAVVDKTCISFETVVTEIDLPFNFANSIKHKQITLC